MNASSSNNANDTDYSSDNGGNRAIGTSGTSTQGAWGYNPAGIRIGQGISRNKRAVQVAERRASRTIQATGPWIPAK